MSPTTIPSLIRHQPIVFASIMGAVLAVVGLLLAWVLSAAAQAPESNPAAAAGAGNNAFETQVTRPPVGPEQVEADISTRTVAITSSFTGVEVVVFGAIDNTRSQAAEAGLYDVVVVVEGDPDEITARRKSRTAGIWINTRAVRFENVPSYYAISSTRPLDEIAEPFVLEQNGIGFEQINMRPVSGWETGLTSAGLADFRDAVVRLKQRDGLYRKDDFGVVFVGRSLFRTTIDLPANVPVGPLSARVHIFREGDLIDTFNTRLMLEREGLERYLHAFAFSYPLFYGIATVLIAGLAGLAASAAVQRLRSR